MNGVAVITIFNPPFNYLSFDGTFFFFFVYFICFDGAQPTSLGIMFISWGSAIIQKLNLMCFPHRLAC